MSKKKRSNREDAYLKAADAAEKAHESTTPFPIVNDKELIVAGDANETQLNKHDFKVRFRIPVEKDDGSVEYTLKEKEYKGVYITPRQDAKIVSVMSKFLPFFNKISDEGDVKNLSFDEKIAMFREFDDDIMDGMYDLTVAVLGIDKALRDYMLPQDAMSAAVQIMELYPEVVNTADTFFG